MRNEGDSCQIALWIVVLLCLHITSVRYDMCIRQNLIAYDNRARAAALSWCKQAPRSEVVWR